MMVAPVAVGAGAIVGAGGVVVRDVPADALAIARGEQVNRDGAARRYKERGLAAKQAQLARQREQN